MKQLKFKSYDSGFVRAYFKHDKTLYCVQPGMYLVPELLVCSRDGEPSHPAEDGINYTFTNMPRGGSDWNWCALVAFFNGVESQGQLMRRMDDMFVHDLQWRKNQRAVNAKDEQNVWSKTMNKANTIYDKYYDSNKSENRLAETEAMALTHCKDPYIERHYKVYEFHDGSTLVFTHDNVKRPA